MFLLWRRVRARPVPLLQSAEWHAAFPLARALVPELQKMPATLQLRHGARRVNVPKDGLDAARGIVNGLWMAAVVIFVLYVCALVVSRWIGNS